MPRSMADPNYVYTPRSPEVRRKLSLAHKRRLGIPDDSVRIYGIHVPQAYEWPLRYYAAWVRWKHDWAAAQTFVLRAIELKGRIAKPSPDRAPSALSLTLAKYPDIPREFRTHAVIIDRLRRANAGREAAIRFVEEAAATGWTMPIPAVPHRVWSPFRLAVVKYPDMPEEYRVHAGIIARSRREGRGQGAAVEFIENAAASGWAMPIPEERWGTDWALVEELLSEYATREEVADFLGITEGYLRNVLRKRKAQGLSSFGAGRKAASWQ